MCALLYILYGRDCPLKDRKERNVAQSSGNKFSEVFSLHVCSAACSHGIVIAWAQGSACTLLLLGLSPHAFNFLQASRQAMPAVYSYIDQIGEHPARHP